MDQQAVIIETKRSTRVHRNRTWLVSVLVYALTVAAMGSVNGQGIGPPSSEESRKNEIKYRVQLKLLLSKKSESREIADAWENLGEALVFQHPGLVGEPENEEEAECFRQAVSAQRQQLQSKKDCASLAEKLGWLGLSYCAQGKHVQEKGAYEQMVAADEMAFGKNADRVALDLGQLEPTYTELKEWENLRNICKRELDIFSQTRREDIVEKQLLLEKYAKAFEGLNQPALAEKQYLESIALYSRIAKSGVRSGYLNPEWRFGPSEKLAAMYVKTGRYADAEKIYRRILSADIFPPDRGELLDVLEKQGKTAEAIKICQEYRSQINSGPLRKQAETDVRFQKWCSRCDSLAGGKGAGAKR